MDPARVGHAIQEIRALCAAIERGTPDPENIRRLIPLVDTLLEFLRERQQSNHRDNHTAEESS